MSSEIASPSTRDGQTEAAKLSIQERHRAHADINMALGARWLLPSRIVWALVALVSVAMFIIAVPATYDRLNNLLFTASPQGRDTARQAFAQLGMSTAFFAGYNVALLIARTLVFFAAAAIIFARKSNDLMAYFVSIFLLTFSVGRMVQVLSTNTSADLVSTSLIIIAYSSFVLFFYIFPNGRFVPGWTRLLAPIWFIVIALAFFFPSSPADIRIYVPSGMTVVTTVVLAFGAFAQIYRYRHAAGPSEKQQIKWVAYGATIILAINIIFVLLLIIFPDTNFETSPTAQAALYQVVEVTAVSVQLLIIPVALGITIMRYRLWDIDIIINRTLVYVPLTGIVAGLYSATVALFQKLFQAFTGSQSDIAIILTTLLLASLFTPLKNGLQALVDKRFKEPVDPIKGIKTLGNQVAQRIYELDPRAVTLRFFQEATTAFQTGGALYLDTVDNNGSQVTYTTDGWQDSQAQIAIPLQAGERQIGKLLLGSRPEGHTYRERDTEALHQVAGQIASAIQAR